MRPTEAHKQAARLALLDAALCAVMRAASDEGFDGVTVVASCDDGQTVIDLSYLKAGIPVTGHDL